MCAKHNSVRPLHTIVNVTRKPNNEWVINLYNRTYKLNYLQDDHVASPSSVRDVRTWQWCQIPQLSGLGYDIIWPFCWRSSSNPSWISMAWFQNHKTHLKFHLLYYCSFTAYKDCVFITCNNNRYFMCIYMTKRCSHENSICNILIFLLKMDGKNPFLLILNSGKIYYFFI